jgi:hypothetical protein
MNKSGHEYMLYEGQKRCSKCKEDKLLEEFHKNKYNKEGYHHYCKSCNSTEKKTKYLNSPEYRTKKKQSNLKASYNLIQDEYDKMLDSQNNKCAICRNNFESESTTFVDHDHLTGLVRGLLCPNCNTALGLFHDNINTLKSAILYLE